MDKKSKLLIFSNDLKKGGIEKVIINSLIYFNTYKYKTDILLIKNNIQFVNLDLKKYKIDFIIDNKKKLTFLNVILNFKKILNIFYSYNIIISHHDFSNYLNLIISYFFKNHKSIIVIHTYPKFYFYNQKSFTGLLKFIFHKYLQKFLYKFANEVIVISNDLKKYVTLDLKRNSTLIYNPIIKTKKNFSKINYNIKSKNFICIGSLKRLKNHIYILKVFNELNKIKYLQKYNINLEIIGEGKQYKYLSNYIKNNNLNKYVKIKKNYDDLGDVYKNSYFLISASLLEGIPNVFVESQSYNLPIITSDIPAAFELTDNITFDKKDIKEFEIVDYGIIFNQKNKKNLVNAIKFIISNNDEYAKIKFNLSKNESKFTYNNNSQYLKIIESIDI